MIEDLTQPADLSARKAALLARLLDPRENKSMPLRQISPRKDATYYPLSPGQRRMWLLDQFEKGIHYNENLNFRLAGNLSVPVLRRVLCEIARRHEAMRSAFALVDGQLLQRLTPSDALELPVIDLRSLPEASREAEAMRLGVEEARKPIDLSTGPLWRFTLLLIGDRDSILLITAHHIAVDGWSWTVFRREFATLYQAFHSGKPSPLPDPGLQYADYAAWQTQWLQSEAADQQRKYWMQHLTGAPPLLELPADRPRPSSQSFRGAHYSITLPVEIATAVKALSAHAGVTLFTTLLAAFETLIKRYTARDEIVVGTPVANRSCTEIEGLIGFFVNTLVLRDDLSGDPTFRDLLQRVRGTMLDALANQELPFEQLVDLLHPERTESYSPLIQVLIVLRNTSLTIPALAELACSRFEVENGTSKFDLSLYLGDKPEGLSCTFEYNTDLFDAARIERMAEHFRVLLQSIVRDPGQRLSELHILTPEERRYLLVEANNTQAEFPADKCVHQLFEEQAASTPAATAVVFEESKLSYADLNRRANQLAHHLADLGVGPEELVGVCLERSLDMVVGVLGILKAGGTYVPLDPSFPQLRLGQMVEDSGMRVLLTHHGLEQQLPSVPPVTVRLDGDRAAIARASADSSGLPEAGRQNRAYVLYTSGSTGKPKGVEIPHSALVNFLFSMQREPGFRGGETLLAVTTLSFDIAGLEIYLPLITGGAVVIASREDTHDPMRLMKRMRECGCTVMQATPATWHALIQAGWEGSPDLKVLCGGEALARDLAEQLLPRCAELWNMYGPTETTIWSSLHKVSPGTGPVPIGRPIANTQLYILNAELAPVPIGVGGELYIGGEGLARGYLHRQKLTGERFVANPFLAGGRMYRTGDLARWLPDGVVECLGRVDNQVKIRGFRIELGEIEARLAEHPALRQTVVIAREDTPGNRRLIAYYTSAQEDAVSPEQLRLHVSATLPEYMVPAAFVRLDALPQTPNGKLDRKALPAPESHAFSTRAYEPPQGKTEEELAKIWAKVLKLDRIGRHDNFFELGGHSLLAITLIEYMRRDGFEVDARTLFLTPSLSELAATVERIEVRI